MADDKKKGKAFCLVLTGYQDSMRSYERNEVAEVDLDHITPGENLRVLTEAEVKAWRRKTQRAAAEANGELLLDEAAA